jgi:hypothetical protein
VICARCGGVEGHAKGMMRDGKDRFGRSAELRGVLFRAQNPRTRSWRDKPIAGTESGPHLAEITLGLRFGKAR